MVVSFHACRQVIALEDTAFQHEGCKEVGKKVNSWQVFARNSFCHLLPRSCFQHRRLRGLITPQLANRQLEKICAKFHQKIELAEKIRLKLSAQNSETDNAIALSETKNDCPSDTKIKLARKNSCKQMIFGQKTTYNTVPHKKNITVNKNFRNKVSKNTRKLHFYPTGKKPGARKLKQL